MGEWNVSNGFMIEICRTLSNQLFGLAENISLWKDKVQKNNILIAAIEAAAAVTRISEPFGGTFLSSEVDMRNTNEPVWSCFEDNMADVVLTAQPKSILASVCKT